jgi:antitoxin (DNA-binding transcriptional repressor) of toxin-antitoxin stability system
LYNQEVKHLNASDFRAACLALLDDLPREGVVILKRGKPVAKLVPIVEETSAHLIGALKGKFKVLGDTMSTGIKWEADY